MVATTHPLAAQIGLDVLKSGGNAVDAAVATNAALNFLEPCNCGIGGDLFALVWHHDSQKLYGLNASGRAPLASSIQFYRDRGLDFIPHRGVYPISVPGCVDGWSEILARFGSRPLAGLLEPVIALAERGAPVPQTIAGLWSRSEAMLSETEEAKATFLPTGKAPAEGERFRNPRLAKTLRAIADGGRDAYYKGRIAKELVVYVKSKGGLLAEEDFAQHTSTWVDPISTDYRGYRVWQIPPNGQGLTVLQMLNLLEGFDLQGMGHGTVEYWHTMIEAKKLAYADRAKYYADPAFSKVPTDYLKSKGYADQRRALIGRDAATNVNAGDINLEESDTVYLTVVDEHRNAVSLIQSNYMGFGSGVMAGDLGFMLQNRGLAFSLDPTHANALVPGKRPFHTIIPGFVTKDSAPWLSFGVMGGDMQPQGQVQVLSNLVDFGMNLQEAGDAPRIEHVGSQTPEGVPNDGSGTCLIEPLISDEVAAGLEARGHRLGERRLNGGSYQGIRIVAETGMLMGASESRRDGQAVGY